MTPEYITEDMTWNEVMSALDFAANYEEPKVAKIFGKRYKKSYSKWLQPKSDSFREDTKAMIGSLKRGG